MPKRPFSVKEEVLDVDDDLRCHRSDGRKWRCRRRAMPGVSFCEHHHLGIKSNSELRQRNRSSYNEKSRKKTTSAAETPNAGSKKRKKKMELIKWVADADSEEGNLNLMRGRDSELQELCRRSDSAGEDSDPDEAVEELLRMAIKRQMERRMRREKRMEMEKESEVRMDLPNGVMAISSSPVMFSGNAGDIVDRKIGLGGDDFLLRRRFRSKNAFSGNAGEIVVRKAGLGFGGDDFLLRRRFRSKNVFSGNAGDIVDQKIGLGFGGDDFLLRRRFRSKNVEPAPLWPVKKLPRVLGRRQRKVCDKCGEKSCKTCMQRGAIDSGSKGKLGRTRYCPYSICQKLPIQQLNWEQMSELEIEANNQGRKLSGVQLEVAEYGHDEQLKCNSCIISIGDLHRSCSKCSYKLCLSCCQEIRKGSLLSGVTLVSGRYLNGTKAYKHVGETPNGVTNKFDMLHSLVEAEQRDKNTDDNMSCPPSEHGGCSDGVNYVRLDDSAC